MIFNVSIPLQQINRKNHKTSKNFNFKFFKKILFLFNLYDKCFDQTKIKKITNSLSMQFQKFYMRHTGNVIENH